MKRENKKKRHISLIKILILMILICSGLIALTHFEMARYEDGILDVCATQQDSYVQLVIDQIYLKENRSDEEIIEKILNTMDSSSNRYWTFSKEQTMLFVKDALETNRYQALTANSYYTTESSRNFVDSLELRKVKHQRIILDNKEYIASGALFEYAGEEYRICLLTNTTVLLDNNKFLGSKMELIIIFAVSFSMIFIFPIAMTMIYNRSAKKVSDAETDLEVANKTIESLNEKLITDEIYDNRKNLFNLSVVEKFVDAYMNNPRAFPISFIAYRYGQNETVANFFGKNSVLLGKKDIKFYDGQLHLALIMSVQCSEINAENITKYMVGDHMLLTVQTAKNRIEFNLKYKKTLDAMGNPDFNAKPISRIIRPDSRTESRYRAKE